MMIIFIQEASHPSPVRGLLHKKSGEEVLKADFTGMSWEASAAFACPILSVTKFDLLSSPGLRKLQETIELATMLARIHI